MYIYVMFIQACFINMYIYIYIYSCLGARTPLIKLPIPKQTKNCHISSQDGNPSHPNKTPMFHNSKGTLKLSDSITTYVNTNL